MKWICMITLLTTLFLSMSGQSKPVFVCGGGHCPEAFQEFVKLAPEYLILTAREDWMDDSLPGKFKIIIVKTKEEANSQDLVRQMLEARGLYITGGDQYVYHKEWAKTKLSETLQQLIGRIPIILTSASSMVFGEAYFTAEHGFYYDGPESEITIGRDFVEFLPFKHKFIDTHFTDRDRARRLDKFCRITGFNGIGIDEGGCLVVKGNKMKELVKGKVHFCN